MNTAIRDSVAVRWTEEISKRVLEGEDHGDQAG